MGRGMQRPWGACRRPAAARSCGPACRGGAPDGRGAGEEGCRRWGRSSAGAWEAGRGRATPRWRTRRGGRTETGSLTDRDSSPAPGGPSGHAHKHTHTHEQETGRVEEEEQDQDLRSHNVIRMRQASQEEEWKRKRCRRSDEEERERERREE